MVNLNEKADILIKYFIEDQKIRELSRNTRFSRNIIRKYVRDHFDKLKDLDQAKNRDEILTLIESLVEAPKYNSSNRIKYKLNESIKKISLLVLKLIKKEKAEVSINN
ncbi:MAG: hypothetical protein ACOCRX_10145 [Candidatus Woesearchaeota archaeon]